MRPRIPLTMPRHVLHQPRWRTALVVALLVFVGVNLRTVILGVPPILPLLRRDLGLSYTETGLLTALPVLIMGGLAWPAGRFAGRFGGRTGVALGLALLAVGAALRAVWPSALPIFLFTTLLSLGIACAQTSVPVLARQWFPGRIGLVSALFSDGLILGETISAIITIPLILGVLGRDAWAGSFVFWSIPVALVLVLWLVFAPPAPATQTSVPRGERIAVHSRHSRQPRPARRPGSVSAWHLGALLGAGSLIYFGMNGWIATYNEVLQHGALTPLALGTMNAAQLPVSLGITPFAGRLAGRRAPFIITGVVGVVAISGWVFAPIAFEPLWAALLGGSSALVFTLGIALPALMAGQAEVARLTGAILTISYGMAFLGPLLGGGLLDLTNVPAFAFLPVALAALLLVVLGVRLPEVRTIGREDFAPAPPSSPATTPPTTPSSATSSTMLGTEGRAAR